MVALQRPQWRALVAPIAFLLVATLAVVLLRAVLTGDGGSTAPKPAAKPPAATRDAPRVYTVRPGDTLATIAKRTGVPLDRLERLNPNVGPTSLFIGDHIRLR